MSRHVRWADDHGAAAVMTLGVRNIEPYAMAALYQHDDVVGDRITPWMPPR
ncbi:hypothetical protein [Streptomyces wuyuanensis]|uniref:hypothetical protein n=1 Tax=Streptomyces wuyuanensis TaxID=1196353 RepID=UPI003712441E